MGTLTSWFAREVEIDDSGESRRAASAANDVVFASMAAMSVTQFFGKRNFSAATVQMLIENRIVLPEELLFLPLDYIKGLSGLTPAGLAEIRDYRTRFPPPSEDLPV